MLNDDIKATVPIVILQSGIMLNTYLPSVILISASVFFCWVIVLIVILMNANMQNDTVS